MITLLVSAQLKFFKLSEESYILVLVSQSRYVHHVAGEVRFL
uniref:Uncharacterized protein n=1 Tax=Myoviridae sp. cts9u10 TaxID=2825187 RepID=A0A8S5NXI3_9CAUD|nr:MAG TPA: hypothetical protein [Myoviridae sp. cts9u10]